MTSWDKFEETELPPIEAFHSELSMSGVSEDDYQHAQQVWKEFGIRNLGEYHDLSYSHSSSRSSPQPWIGT